MTQISERRTVHNEQKKTMLGASNHLSELTANVSTDEEAPSYLSDNLIFKVFIMCMMCIEKLDKGKYSVSFLA